MTFNFNYGFALCNIGVYFEIRDGLNQSAPLLAKYCEFNEDEEYVYRSSGRQMWLKRHGINSDHFYSVKYTTKSMDVTGM